MGVGPCQDPSETAVKVGARVTLLGTQAAFEAAFKGTTYKWDAAMTGLLGRTVTVVQRPKAGVFGLRESRTSSVRSYPISVVSCVEGPNP